MDVNEVIPLLNRVLRDSDNESRMYALWNKILSYRFGSMPYTIEAQYVVEGSTPDFVIVKLITDEYERNILAVECKRALCEESDREWNEAKDQVISYLYSIRCDLGIVAIGSKFCFVDKNGWVDFQYSLPEHIDLLDEKFAELQLL